MSTNINHNKLTVQEWHNLYESLKTIKNPDVNVLQQFLEAPYKKFFPRNDLKQEERYHDYMQALQLKLKTLTKEPSPIEKTMTRSQLYLTDNPLWTNNMRPKDIIEIIGTAQWLKKYGTKSQILNMFDGIIDFNGDVNYTKLNKLYQ